MSIFRKPRAVYAFIVIVLVVAAIVLVEVDDVFIMFLHPKLWGLERARSLYCGASPRHGEWTKDIYDLKHYGPFKFLPNYRNPCWLNASQSVQCLPYYWQIGFAKCGTSDLFAKMHIHPDLPLARKEFHWLTRSRFAGLSFGSYLQYHTSVVEQIKNTTVLKGNVLYHSRIFGDASASTAWDNMHWRELPGNQNCSQPVDSPATWIRHVTPQAKIIAIVRNPTTRLYSDSMFFRTANQKTQFHIHVVQALSVWRACLSSFPERNCVQNRTVFASGNARLHIGLYVIFLEEWFQIFPRNQIFIVKMEQYSADSTRYLKEIFRFLELDPLPEEAFPSEYKRRANVGKQKQSLGGMCLETQKLLDEFYRPYNQRLARLLGDDSFLWEAPEDAEPADPCGL